VLLPVLLPWVARQACEEAGLGRALLDPEGFDDAYYSEAVGRNFHSPEAALFHYLLVGARDGVSPRPDFDPRAYLRRNPDVEAAGYEPFAHYFNFGRHEGRGATAEADAPDDSLLPSPDIARMLMRPARRVVAASVDVIVPVYGSRRLTMQALDSVLQSRASTPYELVVIDDASPDPVLRQELEVLAAAGHLTLLTNPRNMGFVETANRGFLLHPTRDVVLLNSDTRVFGDWLDRLMAALHSTDRTATASPLSNAATILSYPVFLRDNHATSVDLVVLDDLCAQLAHAPVELPTAHGFCMAVKRRCLDEIGPFDHENFGRGYGEENDFSLRAMAAGWRHVAATSTFVWHRGGASFGSERETLIEGAQQTVERLHPGYAASIQRFIKRDPLAKVRTALDVARIRHDSRPKVLWVGSGAPPRKEGVLTLELVPDIGPYAASLRVLAPDFGPLPNLGRTYKKSVDDLAQLLQSLGVHKVAIPAGGGAGRARVVLRAAQTVGIVSGEV
jgi:GT2 family glycosyltransferase